MIAPEQTVENAVHIVHGHAVILRLEHFVVVRRIGKQRQARPAPHFHIAAFAHGDAPVANAGAQHQIVGFVIRIIENRIERVAGIGMRDIRAKIGKVNPVGRCLNDDAGQFLLRMRHAGILEPARRIGIMRVVKDEGTVNAAVLHHDVPVFLFPARIDDARPEMNAVLALGQRQQPIAVPHNIGRHLVPEHIFAILRHIVHGAVHVRYVMMILVAGGIDRLEPAPVRVDAIIKPVVIEHRQLDARILHTAPILSHRKVRL